MTSFWQGLFGSRAGRDSAGAPAHRAVDGGQGVNLPGAHAGRDINIADTINRAERDQYITVNNGKTLPPEFDVLLHAFDRRPQRTALADLLRGGSLPNRPLCFVIIGHDDDMPELVVRSLHHCASTDPHLPPTAKSFVPCRLVPAWPSDSGEADAHWQTINTKIFDKAPGQPPRTALTTLAKPSASMAFGLRLKLRQWEANGPAATGWIREAAAVTLQTEGVLAIVCLVIIGEKDQSRQLETLQGELRTTFRGEANIVVLPTLLKVKRDDLETWLEDVVPPNVRAMLSDAQLDALPRRFFPGSADEKWMQEVWIPVMDKIIEAVKP